MNLKYIFPTVLVALIAVAYVSDPVEPPEPEVKHVIKLTTRHLPIHKYFADEDDDDSLTVAQQYMIVRRDTVIKAQVDIAHNQDDYVLSDDIRLRLMLARFKALDAYQKAHSST